MKAWKDSASLILAARQTQRYIRPSSTKVSLIKVFIIRCCFNHYSYYCSKKKKKKEIIKYNLA